MSDTTHRPHILIAVANPERERQVLTALRADECTVTGRCLDAPSLVRQALTGGAVAAVVSADLHRLTRESLATLHEAGVPVLLLARATEATSYKGLAYVLSAGSDGPSLVAALHEAIRRGAVGDGRRAEATGAPGRGSTPPHERAEVLVLASGKGAPGTTTVAIGLAATLGAAGRNVVLIDGDLRGGSVGPYLDLDPRHGLAGFTLHSSDQPDHIEAELQHGPGFAVLAGLERPEAGERLSPECVSGVIAALRGRFDTVVVDAGETIAGVTLPAGGAFITDAGQVLVVTTADLAGLWNARSCLRFVTESLGMPLETVSALVNRHAGNEHFGEADVERALGVPVLGVIRDDRRAARHASQEQMPITSTGGKAARQLRALGQALSAPELAEAASEPQRGWTRWRWHQPAEGRR